MVTKLEFIGNDKVSDRALSSAIVSQASGTLPFAAVHRLDARAAGTDVERIERYYQALGFYQAEVDGWRFASSSRGRGKLAFIVREGPRVWVKSIEVLGLDDLPAKDRDYVRSGLPLHVGSVMREDRYELTRDEVLRRLRLRGYADADVTGRVTVSPEDQRADVQITVDPGAKFRLGPIHVTGIERTARKPVLWASALETGQLYSTAKIEDAQGRVYQLGAFRAVSIFAGPPDELHRRPITIQVTEAKRHTIEAGAGVALDRIREQAIGTFRWTDRDLLGGLDDLELTLRGGYAVLPTVVNPVREGPVWGGDLRFRRQNFIRRSLALEASTSYDRTIEEGYSADSAIGSVGLDRTFQGAHVGLAYGLNVYRLTDVTIASAATQPNPEAAPDRCSTPCLISFLTPRAAWDGRSDPIEPLNGAFTAAELEKGGGILGGTSDYWRVSPEIRGYQTPARLGQRITFAARARFGWMLPVGGPSPIVRRFFSGGSDSMRGYAARRLSPMVHDENGRLVPIGGDDLFEASAEARAFLTKKLIFAAFLDAGAVQFQFRDVLDPANIALAAGPGLRYLTPVGPVRVDVGYRFRTPVAYTLDTPVERVDEPIWTVQVGLGEAF